MESLYASIFIVFVGFRVHHLQGRNENERLWQKDDLLEEFPITEGLKYPRLGGATQSQADGDAHVPNDAALGDRHIFQS